MTVRQMFSECMIANADDDDDDDNDTDVMDTDEPVQTSQPVCIVLIII